MRELKLTVKSRFFSTREIIIYILIFVGVSFMLFPKGKLESYALTEEKTNITLYVIYIKNLSRIKDDDTIRLHLVASLTQAGEFKEAELEAYRLLNTKYRDKAYVLFYNIEKAKFFSKKDGNIEKMQAYLLEAINSTKDRELLILVHREAISMNLPFVAMKSSEKLYKVTGEIEWLKRTYRYANALTDMEKSLSYAFELYKKDLSKKDRKALFMEIVQMYIWKGEYDSMKEFIRLHYMEFVNDEEVLKFVLRSALATGDSAFVREIAEGIKSEVLK